MTFFLLLSLVVNGQSYVELSNSTGYDLSIQHPRLDSASSLLISSLPEIFRDDFQVYDLGFYTILGSNERIFQDIWESATTEASSQSDYFILFGRHLLGDGTLDKISVKLELPREGSFSCSDESYFFNLEFQISQEVERVLSNYQRKGAHYGKAELAGIDKLRVAIEDIVECCYVDELKSYSSCNFCSWSTDEVRIFLMREDFDEEEIELFSSEGSIDSMCFCENDVPYSVVENNGIIRATEVEHFYLFGDTVSMLDVVGEIEEIRDAYSANGYSFFCAITDNSIFCGSSEVNQSKVFEEGLTYDYINTRLNSVDVGMWIHIQYDERGASVGVKLQGVDGNIIKDCSEHPSGLTGKYHYHLTWPFVRWRRCQNTSVATAMQAFCRLASAQNTGVNWHDTYRLAH